MKLFNFFKRNKEVFNDGVKKETGELSETSLEGVRAGVGTTREENEMAVEEQKETSVFQGNNPDELSEDNLGSVHAGVGTTREENEMAVEEQKEAPAFQGNNPDELSEDNLKNVRAGIRYNSLDPADMRAAAERSARANAYNGPEDFLALRAFLESDEAYDKYMAANYPNYKKR